jgi:hypothetical protein
MPVHVCRFQAAHLREFLPEFPRRLSGHHRDSRSAPRKPVRSRAKRSKGQRVLRARIDSARRCGCTGIGQGSCGHFVRLDTQIQAVYLREFVPEFQRRLSGHQGVTTTLSATTATTAGIRVTSVWCPPRTYAGAPCSSTSRAARAGCAGSASTSRYTETRGQRRGALPTGSSCRGSSSRTGSGWWRCPAP